MFCFILAYVLPACSSDGGSRTKEAINGDTLTTTSQLLTMVRIKPGVIAATILNPWKDGEYLAKYILADRSISDSEIPAFKGYQTLRTPISSALVMSSVHTTALEELGAESLITGVADAQYFSSDIIKEGLRLGKIIDVGNSMSPALEKIIELNPEVIITSPYENAGNGGLGQIGATVVEMADYLETTPLGRAEWILFMGALSGQFEKSEQIFNQVRNEYNSMISKVPQSKVRPLVITELPYNGIWYQPGGHSYVTRLINDAGGRTLTANDKSGGSLQFSIETVYEKGHNAEIWLIKSFGNEITSKKDISDRLSLASDFAAYKKGSVWVANTQETNLYDVTAFHPEKVLADFIAIINNNRQSKTQFYQLIE